MPTHCNSLQGEEFPWANQEGWEGPRELTMRGDPHWGPGELGVTGVTGVDKTLGTQSYLHPLFRHYPSKWDQLTQAESEHISTGPFPRVTCIIGKPRTLLSQRNPKASLTS